jgi:hypothetical protein
MKRDVRPRCCLSFVVGALLFMLGLSSPRLLWAQAAAPVNSPPPAPPVAATAPAAASSSAPAAQVVAQPVAPTAPVAVAAPAVGAPPLAAVPASPEPPLAWDLLHRRYNTWNGPTGGLFLLDGRAGVPGAVRVQLGLDAFGGSDYLHQGDHIEVAGQTLSLSATAHENFEFFAALANRSSTQTRPGSVSLDALGDVTLGGKFGGRLGSVLDLGADIRMILVNKLAGGGFDWGATNLWLRSALSVDLQGLAKPVPFVARFNIGYLFDNTAQLVSDTEDTRFRRLSDAAPRADETRQFVNRFERLANGVNRLDRFTFGVGFEVPLQLAERFYLHPIAEWQLGLPVNRQNFDCPFEAGTPKIGTKDSVVDGCYERNPAVLPMNLAFGVRVVPPVRGLSALVGVDIGLTGTSKFVRELAPNLPWRILFAISYDYDARPVEPQVIVQPAAAASAVLPATALGRVQGIVSSSDGAPISDARVTFTDRVLTALATGSDGRFASEPLTPGPVALQASHPDYEPGSCSAVIAEQGGDTGVRCTLAPKPRVGKVQGQVVDGSGGAVTGARVMFSGPTNNLFITDTQGAISADNLLPGVYSVKVEAGGYFMRQLKANVEARSTTLLSATLTRKPITPSIQVRDDAVVAPSLRFQGESSELDGSSLGAVAEIADLLLNRSDLYLQVQGYGSDAIAMARALVIKQRLVEAGVPEIRIEAVGGGKHAMRFVLHR